MAAVVAPAGRRRRGQAEPLRWRAAPDLQVRLRRIAATLDFRHVDPTRLRVVRTYGSRANAHAQIWGLARIFQRVLRLRARYVVEVLMPAFGRLSRAEQDRVLIHELLHIPTTFSGALRPERTRTFRITAAKVNKLYDRYRAARRRRTPRRRRGAARRESSRTV
ncbi:MAG: putative metallopeptidase [bacterium]